MREVALPQTTEAAPLPAAHVRVESELRALIRVSAAVAAAHRLDDVLEIVAEESRVILGAASVSISRWEPAENRIRTLINVGELGKGEERWPAAELWSLEEFPHIPPLLEAGESSLVVLGERGLPPSEQAMLEQLGKGSCLRVPIVFDGGTWGKLEAFSHTGAPAFTLDRAPFVEALATQVAVAIGRAELFSRVNALAYEDPLTGLGNRRALEERLEAAVARAAVANTPLALLFCDVDRLKELNDSDGHEAGDAALVRVARALTAAAEAYPDSFTCRIGGDEFCVLLEGHGVDAARALARDAERRLECDGEERPLRMSAGAAELQHPRQRPADLFRAADAAQYVAKRAGRGRVYVAQPGVDTGARTAPGARGGRRRMRDAAEPSTHELLDAVLVMLDGRLAGARVSDRLEAVAIAFADAYDAGGWAVSCRPPGADSVRTLFEGGRRAHHVSGVPSLRFGASEDVYPLADYPATAAIMEDGGDFCVRKDDPDGDAAEQALLEHAGYRALVAAAAVHRGAGWLVELYLDERSGPLEEARAALRLLVGEAVRGAS
jgi:diguanylate cyclase (GGDEF)-like protein